MRLLWASSKVQIEPFKSWPLSGGLDQISWGNLVSCDLQALCGYLHWQSEGEDGGSCDRLRSHMHQVWHCMAGMVFTPLLQSACTEKWETLETMASCYLRERQILDFGQSSWTGPPIPTLLDPASRNSNFSVCDWCGSAKAAIVASPLVLLQSLQLPHQINTYPLYNFTSCRVFLRITIATVKTEKTGMKVPVRAALQCI